MRYHKSRKFRYRSNGRNHHGRGNGNDHQSRLGPGANQFSNGRGKNNLNANQGAEKLVEKYNVLAKEALSFGDRILSENYFQHADHFKRIIEEKNLIRNQNKPTVSEETKTSNDQPVEKYSIDKTEIKKK